ncbi:MAG: ABC transporter permease, partial [Coriobacteriia bacterium]|nr:ABC transporter permease [Coriobacteriia bacterium]
MIAVLRRITAIARKEFIHIRRDPRIIVSVLFMPVVQLLLFAYAISFDVDNVPTIMLDEDRTQASREALADFQHSDFFHVVANVDSTTEIDEAFARSEARVAIVVPPGYSEALNRGGDALLAVFVDGSEPNSAQLAQTYSVALSRAIDRQVRVNWLEAEGVDVASVGGIQSVSRTWYNPERRSADFLIPGLMIVIIMIVTIQQTAVTLVREREHGTYEQLTVSPLRRGELMVGKVTPWVILGMVDMAVITLVGVLVFGVPLRGDLVTFVVSTFLFVLCCLAIGLVISARASSTEVANMAGLIISFLPGFMLSGFVFPLA